MAPLKNNLITSTFASEALSIVAAMETIHIMEEENIIGRLYEISDQLRTGLMGISKHQGIAIDVFDPTPVVKFEFGITNAERKGRFNFEFMKLCTEQGLLIRPDGTGFSLCLIAALSDADIDYTIDVFDKAACHLKS
jgi:adenosylmethionine-8-amino-7-oxononanoate aminotransferase